jgi:hypothetical protein
MQKKKKKEDDRHTDTNIQTHTDTHRHTNTDTHRHTKMQTQRRKCKGRRRCNIIVFILLSVYYCLWPCTGASLRGFLTTSPALRSDTHKHTSAYVSIRQHQHTSAYVSIRQHTCTCLLSMTCGKRGQRSFKALSTLYQRSINALLRFSSANIMTSGERGHMNFKALSRLY